jgi:16S rRNA (guanine527-N7)-methyltransferase
VSDSRSAERRDLGVSTAPPVAVAVFGDRLPLAQAYAERLAGDGVIRGLIGPREVPRLWERHLLNCAVLAEELPEGAAVVDVGSGAGLPGLVLAIHRPDLRVTLLEPMRRRVAFLDETVAALDVGGSVRVMQGRAEDATVVRALGGADWVVARAVAPLDRLVKWCLPLLKPGGRLLALKGARVDDELRPIRSELKRLGAGEIEIRTLGHGLLDEPTWVVVVERSQRGRSTGRERRGR